MWCGGAGQGLTVVVLPLRVAGAAVGGGGRGGRGSAGGCALTLVQQTVHVISRKQKRHILDQHYSYLRKNIHLMYCKCEQCSLQLLKCTDLSCKVNNFEISCANCPHLATATTYLLTNLLASFI